jgi:hypothetical protein
MEMIDDKIPVFIRLLANLESTKLTGFQAVRVDRDEELEWFNDLRVRMRNVLEDTSHYNMYLICQYMEFLQFDINSSRVKPQTVEYEQYIARLIKDHLISWQEIHEYSIFCNKFGVTNDQDNNTN